MVFNNNNNNNNITNNNNTNNNNTNNNNTNNNNKIFILQFEGCFTCSRPTATKYCGGTTVENKGKLILISV